jgi:hypothetical protein
MPQQGAGVGVANGEVDSTNREEGINQHSCGGARADGIINSGRQAIDFIGPQRNNPGIGVYTESRE